MKVEHHTTETGGACPKCKSPIRTVAGIGLPGVPLVAKPGDFCVCWICGQICQFLDDAVNVKPVSDAELLEFPVYVRQQIRRMRAIVRQKVERFN